MEINNNCPKCNKLMEVIFANFGQYDIHCSMCKIYVRFVNNIFNSFYIVEGENLKYGISLDGRICSNKFQSINIEQKIVNSKQAFGVLTKYIKNIIFI